MTWLVIYIIIALLCSVVIFIIFESKNRNKKKTKNEVHNNSIKKEVLATHSSKKHVASPVEDRNSSIDKAVKKANKKHTAPYRQGFSFKTDSQSLYGDIESLTATVFFPKGKVDNRTIWRFNKRGDATEVISYNHQGKQNRKEIFTYNEIGILTTKHTYDSENLLWGKQVYLYDSNKRISCVLSYGRDDALERKEMYIYNYNGKLKEKEEVEYWSKDMPPVSTQKYEYDYNGNEINHSYYDMEGSLAWRHSRSILYDSNNNKVEEIIMSEEEDRVNKESCKYKYKYKYDSDGNRIELAIYNSNGSVIQKITSTYDVNGNLLREENDRDVFEITYVYR